MKSTLLFLAILVGFLVPFGHGYAYLIKYAIMFMLLFAFLEANLGHNMFLYLKSLKVVGAMVILASIFYEMLQFIDPDLAGIAALIALTPTAIAAPVVASLIHKNINYVTAAVISTNSLVAIGLPFLLPKLMTVSTDVSTLAMLGSTLTVIFVPILISQGLKQFFPGYAIRLLKWKELAFYAWLLVLYLATSKAAHFLYYESAGSTHQIINIALITLLVCGLNFATGRFLLGEHTYLWEASQSVGHKNTTFMVWVCIEFLSPLSALGPVFYIVFQNLYNSWLISAHRPDRDRPALPAKAH